jgi:hypothetical protein
MIDMHQGFSGGELQEAEPSLATVALLELEAATALSRGQLRSAARGQLNAARELGAVLLGRVRARLSGKRTP